MKIVHEGDWCRIENASKSELQKLANCLTFVEDEEAFSGNIDMEEEVSLTWKQYLGRFTFLQKEEGDFKFLSGLLPYLRENYGEPLEVKNEPEEIIHEWPDLPEDYLEGITLRDFQKHHAEKALAFRRGILHIPTRAGKTEVMIAITKYYLENINPQGKVIFIEPDSSLMSQTYERCLARGLKDVGRLGDGHRELEPSVVVCIVDSLYNIVKDSDHEDYDTIQSVTGIFIDEVHHAGSPSMAQAPIVIPNIELFIGVSGSPFNDQANPHSNPKDVAIIGLLHRVIGRVSSRYLMNKGYIAEPHVFIMGYGGGGYPKYFVRSYNKVYNKFLLWHHGRNSMITELAELIHNYEFNLLILVTRLNHGKFLLKRIHSFYPEVLFAFGGGNVIRHYDGSVPDDLPYDWEWYSDKDDQKKGNKYFGVQGDQNKIIQNHFDSEGANILIGSTIFDEGTDLPQVDALIIAGGEGKSDVKKIQRPARALTRNKYDNRVYIIDFWDDRHKYLKKHSRLRIEAYRRNQYYIHTGGKDELIEYIKESKRIRDKIDG